MEQFANIMDDPQFSSEQRWRFGEFRRQLEYIHKSYLYWRGIERTRPTFNESLALLRRQSQVRGRKRRQPVRLHPLIEIGVSILAAKKCGARLDRSPEAIEAAIDELLRCTNPLRGRPEDLVLLYQVKALILACEWASGTPVTASPTTNSEYGPQMTSDGARAIEALFQHIDPSVTTTSLVNIVRRTRRRRELKGKRFEDFFPALSARAPSSAWCDCSPIREGSDRIPDLLFLSVDP